MRNIYDLKLHETIKFNINEFRKFRVMRVPGGWIYQDLEEPFPMVFVPYSDEFEEKIDYGDPQFDI